MLSGARGAEVFCGRLRPFCTSEQMIAPPSTLLLRRLTLPKFLYGKARDAIERPQPPHSWGLATSLLQDSAEVILRVMAETRHISVSVRASFDTLLDEVEKKLPFVGGHRASLTKLNTTRVAFKHRGQEVAERDARAFVVNVEAFLTETYREAFNVDFASLSLADSIGYRRTQNWLRKAEEAFAAEDHTKVVGHAAKAMTIYLGHITAHDPAIDFSRVVTYQGVPEGFKEQVQVRLSYLRARLDLSTRGVDISAFDRFMMLTPSTTIIFDTLVHQHARADEPLPSRDEARFCIDFVVDAALALRDSRILPASRSNEKSDRVRLKSSCEVLAHWKAPTDMEIAIGTYKEREVIRVAEAGEEFTVARVWRKHPDYVAVIQDGDPAYVRRECVEEIQPERSQNASDAP